MSTKPTPKMAAFDLGTKTGFAFGHDHHGHVLSGWWQLKPGRFDGGGMRFVKFKARLDELHETYPFERVYFEEVRNHKGTDAAHVYGGLLGMLTSWCEERKIPYEGVPVGAIKKFATGKGNADKAAVKSSVEAWGFKPESDDEADALALLCLKLYETGGVRP